MTTDDLLTVPEVAARLGVSVPLVRRWLWRGVRGPDGSTRRLQRYTTPFRLLVPSSEVERLAAERAPRLSMTEPEAPQGAGSQE